MPGAPCSSPQPSPGPSPGGRGRHRLLRVTGLSALQAIGGEFCRHCLTGHQRRTRVEEVRADRTAPLFYDQILRMRRSLSKSVRRTTAGAEGRQPRRGAGGTMASSVSTAREDHPSQDHQPGHVPVGRGVPGPGPPRCTPQCHQRHPPDLTGRENVYLYGACSGCAAR